MSAPNLLYELSLNSEESFVVCHDAEPATQRAPESETPGGGVPQKFAAGAPGETQRE